MGIKLGDALVYLRGDNTPLTKDLAEGKKQTTAWTVAVGTAVGNLMGQAISGGVRLATGAVKTLGKELLFLTMDAAKLESTTNTFNKLAESVGGNAAEAMEQLRAATRGMIADGDLMQAGNKFLAMGLAETTAGAAEMAEMATQLGTAMGEDATSSMENFALMMANQANPRLDSFGISSSNVNQKVNALLETNSDLTRSMVWQSVVMEEARLSMEKVGEQAGTSAAKMASLQATIANLKLKAGQTLQPILDFFVNFASGLVEKYGPQVEEWLERLKEPMVSIGEALQFLADGDFDSFFGSLSDALVALGVPQETLDKLFWFFKDMWAAIQDLRDGDVEGFIQNFKQALYDLGLPIETINNVEKAIRWLIETWDKLKESFFNSKRKIKEFGEAVGKRLEEPLGRLKKAFSDLLIVLGIESGGDGTLLTFFKDLFSFLATSALEVGIVLLELAIDGLAVALGLLAASIYRIQNTGFVDFLGEMFSALTEGKLPSWLTPGSPTPLENAIRGIGQAAHEERKNLEAFFNVGGEDGLDFSALEKLPESMREAALLIKTAMEEGRVALGKDLTAKTFTPLETAMSKLADAGADEQKRLSEFFRFGKQGQNISALADLPADLKTAAQLVLKAAKEGRAELFEDFTFEIWDDEPILESIMSWKKNIIDPMKETLTDLLSTASTEQLEMLRESATNAGVPLDELTRKIQGLVQSLAELGGQDNRSNTTVYGGVQNYAQGNSGNPLENLWNLGAA